MLSVSPPLMASLGRRGRLKVLETLTRYPARAFTVNELARESGVPTMTCWRAVREFEPMGLVTIDTVGKAFAVRLNAGSAVVKVLKRSGIIDYQRNAAHAFARFLKGVNGVVGCYLFGSVSRSAQVPASDVDVAVVYDPRTISRMSLEKACVPEALRIQRSTGARIVPLYLTKQELDRGSFPVVIAVLAGVDLWKNGR